MTLQTSQSFLTEFKDSAVSVTFEGSEIAFSQEMMMFPVFEMTVVWNANNEFLEMNNSIQERRNAQQYGRENQ